MPNFLRKSKPKVDWIFDEFNLNNCRKQLNSDNSLPENTDWIAEITEERRTRLGHLVKESTTAFGATLKKALHALKTPSMRSQLFSRHWVNTGEQKADVPVKVFQRSSVKSSLTSQEPGGVDGHLKKITDRRLKVIRSKASSKESNKQIKSNSTKVQKKKIL